MRKEKIIDRLPATKGEENLMSALLSLFILGVLGDVMALGSQLEIVNDNIFTDEQNTLVDHFSMIAELLASYSFMAMIAVFARVAHRLGRTVSGWTIVSYASWILVVFGAIYLTDVKPLELFSEADYSGEAFYISWKTIVSLSRWVTVATYLFILIRMLMLTSGRLYRLIISQICMLASLIFVVVGAFIIWLLGFSDGINDSLSHVIGFILWVFIIADVIAIGVVWKRVLIGDNNTTI